MWQKSNKILLVINAIGVKSQVGTEEIRVKLKLFELCLTPANTTWTSSMGKDNDKRNRGNGQNTKYSTQTITASPNININSKSTDGVFAIGVFPIQCNDAIS